VVAGARSEVRGHGGEPFKNMPEFLAAMKLLRQKLDQ